VFVVVKHHADVRVQQQQPPAEGPAFDHGHYPVPNAGAAGKLPGWACPEQPAHVIPIVRQHRVVDVQLKQGMPP
jgi:hypothetical protein